MNRVDLMHTGPALGAGEDADGGGDFRRVLER
jgi:hypothetical protein